MQSEQTPVQDVQKKFESFFQVYKMLNQMLMDLPIHPVLVDKIRFEFDTGYLWVKEAISANQAKVEQEANEPAKPVEGELIQAQEEIH